MFIPPSKGSPFISSPLECGLTLTSHTVTHGPHVKTSYTLHFYFLESSFCVKKSKISCMGNDVGREKPCGMRDHKREKMIRTRTSLVVQWPRLPAPKAGGLSSIPVQGTRSHMIQPRVHILQLKRSLVSQLIPRAVK